VVVGPYVWNFADTAACQIADAAQLETVLRMLLEDANERHRRGTAARAFVLRRQGATEQTIAVLSELMTAQRARVA
jgi:3-deoxy-D-manno-octulosonic-acid transferase